MRKESERKKYISVTRGIKEGKPHHLTNRSNVTGDPNVRGIARMWFSLAFDSSKEPGSNGFPLRDKKRTEFYLVTM